MVILTSCQFSSQWFNTRNRSKKFSCNVISNLTSQSQAFHLSFLRVCLIYLYRSLNTSEMTWHGQSNQSTSGEFLCRFSSLIAWWGPFKCEKQPSKNPHGWNGAQGHRINLSLAPVCQLKMTNPFQLELPMVACNYFQR